MAKHYVWAVSSEYDMLMSVHSTKRRAQEAIDKYDLLFECDKFFLTKIEIDKEYD